MLRTYSVVEGFILFACFIVLFGWFLMRLRAKEIESFLSSDFDGVPEPSNWDSDTTQVDPVLIKAQTYLKEHPATGIVTLPSAQKRTATRKFKTRDRILSARDQQMLKVLREELGGYDILWDVCWSDFIEGDDEDIRSHSISFLICDENYAKVVAGIDYTLEYDSRRSDLMRSVFEDIAKPLILFPFSDDLSEEKIREGLSPIRKKQVHVCSKCTGPMSLRKVDKGKNAGELFWVCKSYPGCRGSERNRG